MLACFRAVPRRRGRRVAVVCAIVLLAATVSAAHWSVGGDHMGDAVAICLAVLVGGAASAAALPSVGPWIRHAPRPLTEAAPAMPDAAVHCTAARARGDPAALQVFRL